MTKDDFDYSSLEGLVVTEIAVWLAALESAHAGASVVTGSCILSSAGKAGWTRCVVVSILETFAGLSAKRASTWPLLGASSFHSEAVDAAAS